MNDIVCLVMPDTPETPREDPATPEELREMLEGGAERDADIADLPTGVFKIIESTLGDSERMERIRGERQKRKAESEAERKRITEVDARRSQQEAFRDANRRLDGRPGPGSGGQNR